MLRPSIECRHYVRPLCVRVCEADASGCTPVNCTDAVLLVRVTGAAASNARADAGAASGEDLGPSVNLWLRGRFSALPPF